MAGGYDDDKKRLSVGGNGSFKPGPRGSSSGGRSSTGGRGGRGGRFRGGKRGSPGATDRKKDPEMERFEMDAELMLYNAEKEGKDKEKVKEEIEEMRKKKREEIRVKRAKEEGEKLNSELDEYFAKGKKEAEGKDAAPAGDAEKPAEAGASEKKQ